MPTTWRLLHVLAGRPLVHRHPVTDVVGHSWWRVPPTSDPPLQAAAAAAWVSNHPNGGVEKYTREGWARTAWATKIEPLTTTGRTNERNDDDLEANAVDRAVREAAAAAGPAVHPHGRLPARLRPLPGVARCGPDSGGRSLPKAGATRRVDRADNGTPCMAAKSRRCVQAMCRTAHALHLSPS